MSSLLYSSKNSKKKKRLSFYFPLSLSVTIQSVQEQAHDLWRYQRFLIVNEYSQKTPIPAPFNIFYYLYASIQFFVQWIFNRTKKTNGTFLPNVQQQWKSMRYERERKREDF